VPSPGKFGGHVVTIFHENLSWLRVEPPVCSACGVQPATAAAPPKPVTKSLRFIASISLPDALSATNNRLPGCRPAAAHLPHFLVDLSLNV
jgi:hypothetical protein